jgi:hypothetical protein
MLKHPSEVFGYPIEVRSAQAQDHRARHWCPFMDRRCDKQSRLVSVPFGVCSIRYGEDVVALCSRRFLEDQTVFLNIADRHFGTRNDLLLFEEVSVPGASNLGRFDYVLARHKPLGTAIEDFVAVEFQTGQTTDTGKLVQGFNDFLEGREVGESYRFGLNLADIWKRTFTQVLTKGIALERWGHCIYWVVQERVYRDFVERYQLEGMACDPGHRTLFSIYDLRRAENRYELCQTTVCSKRFAPTL